MQVRTVMLVRRVMQVRTVMLVRRVMQVRTVMLVRRVMQVRTGKDSNASKESTASKDSNAGKDCLDTQPDQEEVACSPGCKAELADLSILTQLGDSNKRGFKRIYKTIRQIG